MANRLSRAVLHLLPSPRKRARRRTAGACLVALTLAASGHRAGFATELPSIAGLLDQYRSGAFDAAVRELAVASDSQAVRASFIAGADAWIARDSTDIINRRLVATAFAIELAHARLAYDNPTLIVLLDWARKAWRKNPPSPVERVWTRAAVALFERGGRISPSRTGGKDSNGTFLDDAVKRFPDDARLRLAKLLWRLAVPRLDLQRLTKDPEIGPDALVELAYVTFFVERDLEAARSLAEQAANRAAEPWTRYVAHFIAALSHENQGRYQGAVREYAAALRAVPHAQSASIALAQLLLRDDQPDAAFDLINRSLTERPDGDDPWRLFAYGGYVRWPVLIADVRKAIR